MPIYEYHCNSCGANFEKIISTSASNGPISCEKCSSKKVIKKISAGSYRLSSTSSSIPTGALAGCPSKSGFS
jgi:putative FmdB family regulatory protein